MHDHGAPPTTPSSVRDQLLNGSEAAAIRFGHDGEYIAAAAMRRAGRKRFDVTAPTTTVALMMTNDRPTVEVLLGAIEAGCRVVSLPIPSRTADVAGYVRFISDACESQGVSEVIVRDDIALLLASADARVVARAHSQLDGAPLAAPGDRFELVQFSSGSTHDPKAVLLDDAALGANVDAILATLEPDRTDRSVSWLPLSHDMGLIGMLFTSIAASVPGRAESTRLTLLDPVDFLRRPGSWIEALGSGATITAAPDFGYRLSTRAVVGEVDLSRVRCAIVGGETIRASTLRNFAERFVADGFAPEAFCPGYGLAEVGLAVTLDAAPRRWTELLVDAVALADRRLVRRHLGTSGPASATTVCLVASGPPIPGYEVRCLAPDGQLGPVEVRGPSAGVDASRGESFASGDGWVVTGDLGIVLDGELVVSGRADDHLVTASRNIYAPAVEEAVGRIDGVRPGRVAAFGLASGEWVLALEPAQLKPSGADLTRLRRGAARAAVKVTSVRPDEVVVVPRGQLPVTSSGKLQRREALRRFIAHEW